MNRCNSLFVSVILLLLGILCLPRATPHAPLSLEKKETPHVRQRPAPRPSRSVLVKVTETYEFTNIRVIDADTIEGDIIVPYTAPAIRLPIGVTLEAEERRLTLIRQGVRIRGVNAAERSTPLGKRAITAVQELFLLGYNPRLEATIITTQEKGGRGGIDREKYGRILGDVLLTSPDGKSTTRLSQFILDNNYGVEYNP